MKAFGSVFKYGDNVDTDVIIPARHLAITDPKGLAAHCMEDIDTEFVKKVKEGDIMVARKNFGCGSSREHAPMAIKVSAVLSQRPLPGFSTGMLSTLVFRLLNVKKRQKRLKPVTRWKLILMMV